MATLSLQSLCKSYDNGYQALHNISLEIKDGEFVVLIGPSGCGKSTLLRMIAGLENISAGVLQINGRAMNDVAPQKRRIAMVFQSYALYPHLTARQNIAFGPQIRREAADGIASRVSSVASLLNLSAWLDRLPRTLSGGQRQRVAMGRALVREPLVFLFDEPLSNLDTQLRVQMRTEIKALHQKLGNTIIYVTHDQTEAMTLADCIVVLNSGKIEQAGAPLELYDRPKTQFVSGFLGSPSMNYLPVNIIRREGMAQFFLRDGIKLGSCPEIDKEGEVTLGVRPEHVRIGGDACIDLNVQVVEPAGAETYVHGNIGDHSICLRTAERLFVRPGDKIPLGFIPDKLHFFDTVSKLRLE